MWDVVTNLLLSFVPLIPFFVGLYFLFDLVGSLLFNKR